MSSHNISNWGLVLGHKISLEVHFCSHYFQLLFLWIVHESQKRYILALFMFQFSLIKEMFILLMRFSRLDNKTSEAIHKWYHRQWQPPSLHALHFAQKKWMGTSSLTHYYFEPFLMPFSASHFETQTMESAQKSTSKRRGFVQTLKVFTL